MHTKTWHLQQGEHGLICRTTIYSQGTWNNNHEPKLFTVLQSNPTWQRRRKKSTWKRPRFLEDGALTLTFTGRTFPLMGTHRRLLTPLLKTPLVHFNSSLLTHQTRCPLRCRRPCSPHRWNQSSAAGPSQGPFWSKGKEWKRQQYANS